MEWLAEFCKWFGVVALVLGGPAIYRHYVSPGGAVRRKLADSERNVRRMREITERFERLRIEQRSVEARQAALDTSDLERIGVLRQLCADLVPRAEAERRAPGSTVLERDLEALFDAAASLGDEYSRSASLGHVLELCVHAGLHEQARAQARWVTDVTVRDRLSQNPRLSPVLRCDEPSPAADTRRWRVVPRITDTRDGVRRDRRQAMADRRQENQGWVRDVPRDPPQSNAGATQHRSAARPGETLGEDMKGGCEAPGGS